MAFVEVETPEVPIVNVAEVAPPATITDAGAEIVLLEDRVTVIPLPGATLLRVKAPVAELPPTRVLGLTEIDCSNGVSIVRTAV